MLLLNGNMNKEHRERIDNCCEEIVQRLNLATLWPKLLEHKVFNRDDVNIPQWTKSLSDVDTVRDVYLTIKTRGPSAFESLVRSLKETGQDSLADLLEGRRVEIKERELPLEKTEKENTNRLSTKASETNSSSELKGVEGADTFFHNIQLSQEPLRIQVKKATKFLDTPDFKLVQRYPMRSKPRGLVLLITNIHYKYGQEPPRTSAEHDEKNLITLFEQMGFKVISYRDLTGQQLIDRVKEFSRRKDLHAVHSCFVIISSHGQINSDSESTEILGVDYHQSVNGPIYRTVLCSEIADYFVTESCPDLAEKPKIFIFQMCRGEKKQKAVDYPREQTDVGQFFAPSSPAEDSRIAESNKRSVRNYADMLIAHATVPGYAAFRDKLTGSWFIQILCEVFMNYACTAHIQDLLNMVDERITTVVTGKKECQTLTITSMGFNKHCYLNPGLFDETNGFS